MHSISKVRIRNYRSIKDSSFPLARFTPVVGYNNGGKTNLLSAIRWLLRPTGLAESDFFTSDDPITVEGTIRWSEPSPVAVEAYAGFLEPYLLEDEFILRRLLEKPSSSAKSAKLTIRRIVEGAETWESPRGLEATVSGLFAEPLFIGAMEDAAEDVARSKAGTTISLLIKELVGPLEEAHGNDLRNALEVIAQRLGHDGTQRAPELVAIDEGVTDKLADMFAGLSLKVDIQPPGFDDLFKLATMRVFEGNDDSGKAVSALGHGAQRSIQMALVRHLADLKTGGEDAASRILLVDEPELYLHPQGADTVRNALTRLSEGAFQVIFATHAAHMVGAAAAPDAIVVRKDEGTGTYGLPRIADAVAGALAGAPTQRKLFDTSGP